MDDLNKTLPVSNTPSAFPSDVAHARSTSSVLTSSVATPLSSHATAPSLSSVGSSTSAPLSTAHEADSLDKILADLEAQLKAKQDGLIAHEAKKDVQVEPMKVASLASVAPVSMPSVSVSSPSPSPLAVKKPAEIVVEEKHELVQVKNDMSGTGKVSTDSSVKVMAPFASTPLSMSESVKSVTPSPVNTPSEHSLSMSPGIAAAQKKVIPETVGAVSVMGMSSMKKDAAVPTPPSMPGVGNMGGASAPVKPKKRNRMGAIVGIALLVFTVLGTGSAIMLNLQPGGVFDSRRYAADNMCNVNPGSCTTDADWVNGWYSARTEENKDATPTQTEYTNRDNAVVEVIRNAGDSNAVNYSEQSAARGDNVAVSGTNTNQQSAAEAARITATSFADRSKEDVKNLQALADKAKASGDTKTYNKLMNGVKEAQAQAKAMEGIGAATKTNAEIKAIMDAAKAEAAAGTTGGTSGDTSGGSVYNHAAFANQTLDNMCNNSTYKKCDKYQDWIDGWVAARKQENFGKSATSPEYTDSAKDLDGDPSNGIQIGLITRDETGKLVVNEMVTLDVPAGTTADQIKNMTSNLSVKAGTKVAIYQDATGKVIVLKPTNLSTYDASKDPYNGFDATKCSSLPGCSGGACWCGEQSSGSNGFCGAASIGTKTCNTQILERGGIVMYGGLSEVKNQPCSGKAASRGGGVITCDKDTGYSECAPYLNNGGTQTYKCYPVSTDTGLSSNPCQGGSAASINGTVMTSCPAYSKYSDCYLEANGAKYTCNLRIQKVTTSSFSVNTSTKCLSALSGSVVAGYYCQGANEVNRSSGCNEPSNTVVSPRGGSVCVDDVIAAVTAANKNICGVVQIDVDNPTTQEHYSMNVYSQAGCGTTPVQSNPPRVFNGCTTNCGGGTPTPPPSTPPSSPPPPGSPVCIGISASIPAPRLGQAPTFTCSPAALATRYEFRSKIGTGAYATLAPSTANSNVSSPLTVNASGVYTIQCRPCNANGCANWENL